MKGNHQLSHFQKDQYSAYLQSQLEKFSTFMLAQRKENDKYRHIEDMLAQHHNSLNQMKNQIELIEVYQHQNLQNCEHINKKLIKFEGFQQQLQRLEDRCRLGFEHQSKFAYDNCDKSTKQQLLKEIEQKVNKMEKSHGDLNKRMKHIEEEIDRNKDLILGICRSKTFQERDESESVAYHKDLKKLQRKMHKYFDEKFSEIEVIFKKNQRKRSKSPSFRTPIDFVNTYSSAEQTQNLLSQFKINDQSNLKSDISTLSRQTKQTPIQSRQKEEVFKRSKKDIEKSRDKSKSRSKSKSKSQKGLNRSKSISKKQLSAKHSQKSRSKSPKISKKHKRQQKSVDKSRRSSLSCDKSQKVHTSKSIVRKKPKKCPESCGTRYG